MGGVRGIELARGGMRRAGSSEYVQCECDTIVQQVRPRGLGVVAVVVEGRQTLHSSPPFAHAHVGLDKASCGRGPQ